MSNSFQSYDFNMCYHIYILTKTIDIFNIVESPLCILLHWTTYSSKHFLLKIFNHLPQNIKNLSWNVKKFKLALKRFLLMGSFYTLDE